MDSLKEGSIPVPAAPCSIHPGLAAPRTRVLLPIVLLLALPLVVRGNSPPNTPVITEPSFDGKIVNPQDVHMETAPFSDPDPGDTHLCSDWEIWTITPSARVWHTFCITGVEKVHTH